MTSALTKQPLDAQLIHWTQSLQQFKDKVDNIVKSLVINSIIEATPGWKELTLA